MVLADVIEETARWNTSYLLPLPENPSVLLKKLAARLAIYELKRRNGLLSEQDREDSKDYEAKLLKIASGKLYATTLPPQGVTLQAHLPSKLVFVLEKEPLNWEGWEG